MTCATQPAALSTHDPTERLRNPAEQLRNLSDSELLFQMRLATRGERAMTIRILHHLNEIDRRKLYLDLGFSSLFDYCTRELKYSSSSAVRRIHAARCIWRHPGVLEMLHARELNLGTISLIAPILNDTNAAAILERARGRSYREVERIASDYRPPIAMRDRVRPVRVRVPDAPPAPADVDAVLCDRQLQRLAPAHEASFRDGAPGAASGQATTERKLFVQFLADEQLMEKFEEARALLSHRCSEGTFAEVLAIVLTEFVERHGPKARQKRRENRRPDHAQRWVCENNDLRARESRTDRALKEQAHRPLGSRGREARARWPQDARESGTRQYPPPRSRHVPAGVRDEVFVRDGGACTFISRDGVRCGSTQRLQIDHVRPFAAGGPHDASNLRLLCAAHNRLAAEHTLGKHTMQRFWRRE